MTLLNSSHLITHMNMGLWEHETKYSALLCQLKASVAKTTEYCCLKGDGLICPHAASWVEGAD